MSRPQARVTQRPRAVLDLRGGVVPAPASVARAAECFRFITKLTGRLAMSTGD